jgi:hypothetical protein
MQRHGVLTPLLPGLRRIPSRSGTGFLSGDRKSGGGNNGGGRVRDASLFLLEHRRGAGATRPH